MSAMPMLRIVGIFGICLVVLVSVIPAEIQVRTTASKGFEHAAAYFLLGLVLTNAYRSIKGSTASITILLIVVSGALELIQTWCPGRTPSVTDWFAGVFGAIGVLLNVALRGLGGGYLEGRVRHGGSVPAKVRAHRLHDGGKADEVTRSTSVGEK